MRKIRRWMGIVTAALAVAAPGLARSEGASDYPTRPVHIVVPFAAAGSTDILARVVAQSLSAELGQPFVVDNKPGASGDIGANYVAKAPADGYTLLYTSTNLTANPAVMKVPYDVLRDFAPVCRVAFLPLVLFKSPKVPTDNLSDLVKLIKSRPGQFDFSSSGKGGAPHLAGELFKINAGLQMEHIPYNGAGPALTDVASGQVPLTFSTYTSAQSLLSGKLIDAVAVANRTRLAVLPNVPTFQESGIENMEVGTMNGLLAPMNTPAPIVAKLYAALLKAGQRQEFRAQFISQGSDVLLEDPTQFGAYIRADLARWKTLIAKIGTIQ